jgi:CubicO group peptidase (beta-lactamase class C family)
MRMARLALLPSLFVVACATSKARVTATPEEDAASRVARIEQGLLPAVQVEGEVVRSSLAQRMRELAIPAVSVAVFADYRLRWARAYGLADVDTGAPARVGTRRSPRAWRSSCRGTTCRTRSRCRN